MYILGINAYHGDSSACILRDGRLLAAVEEERFLRIKHWAGFPKQAITYCLREAGAELADLDYIALNRNSWANLPQKLLFVIRHRPSWAYVRDRLGNVRKVSHLAETFCQAFQVAPEKLRAKMVNVEHHRAHVASSFLLSGYDHALLVSVDGFGDFASCLVATGQGNRITPLFKVNYPHSLGAFYSALTQFLGFPNYGDEYKVMGLAAFGKPVYTEALRRIIRLRSDGRFELDLAFFQFHQRGDQMRWDNTAPHFDTLYSEKLCDLLGPARERNSDLSEFHKNVAASVQAVYEEAFFHVLNQACQRTNATCLCLAGGCALNSLANGKVFDRTPIKDIYIPPAAHDGGGSVGAAYYLYHHVLGKPRAFAMDTAYWGPEYSSQDIGALLESRRLDRAVFSVSRVATEEELLAKAAQHLAAGKVVGWFQGRMEWGPRALGNRSILADPRRADMRDTINVKIKFREVFRPFAPSIMEEYVSEYFERDYPDPFMLKVYPIRKEKRAIIPAVTHADGTGRLQTVNRQQNLLYWKLINAFREITGVPVLLNTSFNENEPIVCRPEEALACFLRTSMDVLILGDWIVERI